jgi:hypothetical protein
MAKLSKAELAKREELIQSMKKNKRNLVKKYGSDAEKVLYGRATNLAKKLAEQDMEQNKLREMVKTALMHPVSEKVNEDLNQAVILTDTDHENLMKNGSVTVNVGGKTVVVALKNFNVDMEDYEDSSLDEDLDLGHEDNEPHMIKAELYRIGKYAMELYQMVSQFEGEGEVDFPAWWQAKITTAMNNMVSSKHYLDFEIKEPAIDAVVNRMDDIAPEMEIDVVDDIEAILKKKYGSTLEESVNEDETLDEEVANEGFLDRFKKKPAQSSTAPAKVLSADEIQAMIDTEAKTGTIGDILDAAVVQQTIDLRNATPEQIKMFVSVAREADQAGDGTITGDNSKEEEVGEVDKLAAKIAKALKSNTSDEDQNNIKQARKAMNDGNIEAAKKILQPYIKEGLPKGFWDKKMKAKDETNESYKTLVNKIEKQGKSEKAAKAIAGAVAAYKAKGGGKGPTAKQKG